MDSETLSETSYNTDRTDRTPATPEEDLDEVSKQQYARGLPTIMLNSPAPSLVLNPAMPYQSPGARKAGPCCPVGSQ